MSGLKYYQRTQYLLELIEKERTGSPKELARKLNVTERTVYNIMDSIKYSFGKEVTYSRDRRSYIFSK
jgi:transcriptional antiterminator